MPSQLEQRFEKILKNYGTQKQMKYPLLVKDGYLDFAWEIVYK
jgi:hypothetical protein